MANAASIVQGIIEIFTGGAAVISASSLCVAGAGATLGASCFAAAPAIASGAALSAHGLSLIKNGIENNTDANLIDDLLAPQRMESTGGADGSRGLAKKIGASQEGVDNALEVLGTKKIEQLEGRLNFTETRFQRDASGQLVPNEQEVKLLNRVLDKSKEVIYNISKAFDLVDNKANGINDVDGINDIRATIRQNRVRDDGTQLINDTELNTALIENNKFIEQYQGRASGAFANRFGKASSSSPKMNSIQAQGEIETAKDLLDGNTIVGNVDGLYGIPDKNTVPFRKNPEFTITQNGSNRLAEVKIPDGDIASGKNTFSNSIKNNLGGAIKQIINRDYFDNPTNNAYIRLDFRKSPDAATQNRDWVFRKVKGRLENDFDVKVGSSSIINKSGTDVVEFVEVFYKDVNSGVQKLEIKVENGIVELLN